MTTSGRVLLADDSPHAQRMGERILREEGYEVVTVTDGETAIIRLKDVDPDVVIVDAFLPQVSGYDLCGFIKKQPQHSHVRVLLTSTALEKVDEDHAYKVGADGQLKKPFEASVMLKSLKDLIGGSDKKKRAGTTLDLSYVADETAAKPESPASAAEADSEQASGEKPVSALQAWLQQHDSNALSASAEEEAKAAKPLETLASAPAGGAETVAASEGSRLSNPQLLRRMEEEPEDLSLRNNPVAKLRYSPKPAAPIARGREVEQDNPADSGSEQSRTAAEQGKGGVRSFRVQPINAPNPEQGDAGEGTRTPRKSLLEQLEEFEKASESSEEPAAVPVAKVVEPVATPKEVPAPTKSSLEREVEETLAAQARLESEAAEEEQEKLEVPDLPEDSDDEAFLLMRARKGRGSRPSLLESLGEAEEAQHEPAASVAVEAPEPELAEAVPEPMVASVAAELTVAPEPTAAPDPIVAPEPMAVAAAAAEVPALVAQAAALSINEAGVRLDEEEVRAVVEIAVSAAMPTIVEEVSRCVLLALESRYADKVSQNGNHPHD